MDVEQEQLFQYYQDTAPAKPSVPTVHNQSFDVKGYATQYVGIAKISRLAFLAERCPEQRTEAYRIAITEAKKSNNTDLYFELVTKAMELCGSSAGIELEQKWIADTNAAAQKERDRLEANLANQKRNMLKEQIRVAINDLADWYCKRGDYKTSLQKYMETEDQCTTAGHALEMYLNLARVNLAASALDSVRVYAMQADKNPELARNPAARSWIRALLGLFALRMGTFPEAARMFREALAFEDFHYPDTVSPKAMALYAGLCILVSASRKGIKAQCFDDSKFSGSLDMVPEVRSLISDFLSARYSQAMRTLEKIKPDLQLDMYLAPHLTRLWTLIRNKALLQYFSPFLSVDMRRMAESFNTTVESLERDLGNLIADKQLSARIDAANKVLYAKHSDQRSTTYQEALRAGTQFSRDCRCALWRMTLVKEGFVIGARDKGEKAGASPGAAGALSAGVAAAAAPILLSLSDDRKAHGPQFS